MLRDIDDSWNELSGNDVIDSFEKNWIEWDIDDTIKWFDFVLKCRNKNHNNNYNDDYEIENYSSDDSDDSDESSDNCCIDDEDEKKYQEKSTDCQSNMHQVDYEQVKIVLTTLKFRAKRNLPLIMKSFQFEQIGFQNKKDCKLLCSETKKLMKKYPRKAKRSKTKKHKNDV